MADPEIVEQSDRQRFVTEVEGREARLTYSHDGDRLVLEHTQVPEEIGGRGIGGALVRAAVDRAATDGLVVVPRCPYARQWLEKHPDVAAAATIDWPAADE